MAKRDPEQTYSFGGNLYGKGGRDLAELEKLNPLKGEDSVEGREFSGTDAENNSKTGTGRAPVGGDKDGDARLSAGEYAGADVVALMAEARLRGVEVQAGAKKADVIKVLEAHDKEPVNPAK